MTKKEKQEPVIAYKAFNKDWTCQGFQYEVGKTYKHKGEVKACRSGFHACKNPLDVLTYYPLTDSVFARVELAGTIDLEKDKSCAGEIKILEALTLGDFINTAVKETILQANEKPAEGEVSDIASGYSSTAASSGYSSTAASSGDSSTAASSGYSSTAASSGDYSTAASSGYSSKAASSGYSSTAASSGYSSKAASSGYSSTAASSGDYSKAEVTGEHCAAAAVGYGCQVKGSLGTPVALCLYNDKGHPVKFVPGVIGQKGLKADTWYKLDSKGKFEEVQG